MKKGGDGEVLASSIPEGEKGNTPSVVAGKAGKGRVILSGMNIGCKARKDGDKWIGEEVLSEGEEKILVNSIYWLADQKTSK